MSSNEGIRIECVETCLVCGATGVLLDEGMRDRLFGAAGTWSHLRCPVDGHVWLSPRPAGEDIAKAYETYYTSDPAGERHSFLGDLKRSVEAAMLRQFGYETKPVGRDALWLGKLLSLLPMAGEIAGSRVMWLRAQANGKLLDVGCGNGRFLVGMRELGWDVSGVEPDAKAAMIAMNRFAIPVVIGVLEQVNLPNGSLDVMTAHHVIEHMHDPMGFFRASLRLLKPGGRLVVTTPNIESWGHRLFGTSWRELDVPRHLHLFSPGTIRACAEKAGFRVETLRTTARSTWEVWCASYLIHRDGGIRGVFPRRVSWFLRFGGLAVQLLQHIVLRVKGDIGEGIVLIASRPREVMAC